MKIDPTRNVPGVVSQPETKQVKASPKPPSDQVKISGSALREPTYGRVPVMDRVSSGSSSEVTMTQNARAQKLAEIRSRVESGAYNSREMIEKVVDRLLSSWKLASGPSPDAA